MKPTVYLETTIIGYLAMRPSRDLLVAANQQLTVSGPFARQMKPAGGIENCSNPPRVYNEP